jgi:nucleoside-diphosphate-sugar epimerase
MNADSIVLVTGANGFLGRHVCEHLSRTGHAVRALVRSPNSSLAPGSHRVVANDLRDSAALREALAGVNAVVHLAARVHVMRDSAADPLAEFRRVNVEGTRVLMEAAIDQGVGQFVFVSSVKAMGERGDEPLTEEMPAMPADPYGVSKLEAEKLVRAMARDAGVRAPILRLPLVYGPGMKANMLRLFDAVDRGLPLPLGRIRNRRSLAYVGNVSAAIQAVLGSPAAAQETFLVSDGEDLSTPDLINAIARGLGKNARLLPVPLLALKAAGHFGDLLGTFASVPLSTPAISRLLGSLAVDSAKLRRVTGFCPPYTVSEGISLTCRWYTNR